ncbi:MAG: hypothetical protein U0136_16415 [Bdellovibrionota bacterium]
MGSKDLKARSPLKLIIQHKDGSSVEPTVNYTSTEEQIGWFQRGSAFNSLS